MNLLLSHGFEANYTVGFARGLAANGVNFVLVSDDDIAPRLAIAGIRHQNLRGSLRSARPAWQKAANLIRYYFRLLWIVVRHRGATIHFIGLLNSRVIWLDGILIPLWLRLWAGRYIHTAHNALPHSREQSRLFRWIYRLVYRLPHTIIAHTAKVARQLETEFEVESRRVRVISIGLNEEVPVTTLSSAECRARLRLPINTPIALFFGKLDAYKGVDVLVEAWSLLSTSNARLMITGWCPDDDYARTIRDAVDLSPRGATIEWREGFVPNDDVALWLKAADVVVMPYRNIYQSGVVFLCLRFGMPIVATNVGSLSEYIDEDSGVISDTNDPAGIATALDRFFSNPTRFDREQIAGRAARYSWVNQCALIKSLYA